MELINIRHGSLIIQALYEYEAELRLFRFEDDIKIGEWTIAKCVRIGGPRTSIYKYDIKNYLEFVITDKCCESRIKQYYYNCSDEIMTTRTYEDSISQIGIRRYLENHPIFDSQDWEDYDAFALVSDIKKVVDSEEMTNLVKLNTIHNMLK